MGVKVSKRWCSELFFHAEQVLSSLSDNIRENLYYIRAPAVGVFCI